MDEILVSNIQLSETITLLQPKYFRFCYIVFLLQLNI
jgi:hypothetical protein